MALTSRSGTQSTRCRNLTIRRPWGRTGKKSLPPNHLVLVRTRRFATKGEIGRSKRFSERLAGRVVGGRRSLPANGMNLVNDNIGAQTKQIIVFQEGPIWGTWPIWPYTLIAGLAIALGAMSIPVGSDEPKKVSVLDWSEVE